MSECKHRFPPDTRPRVGGFLYENDLANPLPRPGGASRIEYCLDCGVPCRLPRETGVVVTESFLRSIEYARQHPGEWDDDE